VSSIFLNFCSSVAYARKEEIWEREYREREGTDHGSNLEKREVLIIVVRRTDYRYPKDAGPAARDPVPVSLQSEGKAKCGIRYPNPRTPISRLNSGRVGTTF
jgi:hypothetical protein